MLAILLCSSVKVPILVIEARKDLHMFLFKGYIFGWRERLEPFEVYWYSKHKIIYDCYKIKREELIFLKIR
jgi:hypothetical protein